MTIQPKNIIEVITNKEGKKIIRINFIPAYLGFFIAFLLFLIIFFLVVALIAKNTKKTDGDNLIPIILTLIGVILFYFLVKYFFRQKKILFKGQLSDSEFEVYNKLPGAYSYSDETVYRKGHVLFHWKEAKEVTAYIAGNLYMDLDCIKIKADNHDDFIITDNEEGYLVFFSTIFKKLKGEDGTFYKPQDSKKHMYFFHWERTKPNS